ncbi:MAG: ATP-binding protein [Pirellulales bacterium]
MRWPLRYQILVPFAAVMLVAIVGVAALSAVLAARRTEAQLASQLDGLASTLREATFPLSENVLRQMRGLSGAEFIVTTADASARPITFASTIAVPNEFSLAFTPESLSGAKSSEFDVDRTLHMDGLTYFYLSTQTRPGRDGSRQTLCILYPEARWREARSAAIVPPLVVGCAALAVVSLVSIVISRRLSGPIGQLRSQVGRIAQGDYRPIARPERNDELRDLVESVNSLSSQLDELHGVIRRTERLAVLGQLSGGLAHELRNSVAGARLAVQLHQRACDERDPESLAVALRQLELTESQLRRFLAVGKPATPSRTRFDLREAVEEVAALVRPSSQHRGIVVEATGGSPPIEIDADRDQIRQLLVNLALNAIEAAGSDGRVRITVDATADRSARIRIVDSGPGPPAELLDKLFEPFVTTKPEGVGLGLAVARQIAEAHGGTIALDTTLGETASRETCFEVVLPLGSDLDPTRKDAETVHADRPTSQQNARETISSKV